MRGGSWSSTIVVVPWLLVSGAPAPSSPTLIDLRDDARKLVKGRCGSCHSATSPKAKPAALKVYDVDQVDWTRRMSDVQVKIILERFREPVFPKGEVDRVTAYVEAELVSRKTRTK